MAENRERAAVVAYLRRQSDLGANRALEAGKGTTRRSAFGGGMLALKRAADNIEAGEHIVNDNSATPDRSDDALAEENRRLREALRRIANGTKVALENGVDWPSPLAARHSQEIARAALKGDGL